ncbi:unnamed protein product [Cunninghamella blakesleeana]
MSMNYETRIPSPINTNLHSPMISTPKQQQMYSSISPTFSYTSSFSSSNNSEEPHPYQQTMLPSHELLTINQQHSPSPTHPHHHHHQQQIHPYTTNYHSHPHEMMDYNYLYDHEHYPSQESFNAIVQDYLQNLSSKKRDKALVDSKRYSLILQVLKDPRNTAISTAQFRFWVKKMFQLRNVNHHGNGQHWIVCHDQKPVAMQEQIYPILVRAHREAHHGGRDKTSALVRKRYSWIPKELIARFVRHCPFCISRRNGHLSRPTTATNGNELLNSNLSLKNENHHEELNNDDQSILSSPTMIQSTSITHDYHSIMSHQHHHQQQQQMMYQAPWMTSSPSNPSTMDSPISSIATEAAAKVNYDQQQGTSLYYYPYHHHTMSSPPYSNINSRSNSTVSNTSTSSSSTSYLLQPPPTPTTHMDFNELKNELLLDHHQPNNNNNDSSFLFHHQSSSSPMTNTTINTPSPDTISKPCFSPSTPYTSNCLYASDSPSIDLLSHQQLI